MHALKSLCSSACVLRSSHCNKMTNVVNLTCFCCIAMKDQVCTRNCISMNVISFYNVTFEGKLKLGR